MLTQQMSRIISFMAGFHKSNGFVVGYFFPFLLPHLSEQSGSLPISAPFDLSGSVLQVENEEI